MCISKRPSHSWTGHFFERVSRKPSRLLGAAYCHSLSVQDNCVRITPPSALCSGARGHRYSAFLSRDVMGTGDIGGLVACAHGVFGMPAINREWPSVRQMSLPPSTRSAGKAAMRAIATLPESAQIPVIVTRADVPHLLSHAGYLALSAGKQPISAGEALVPREVGIGRFPAAPVSFYSYRTSDRSGGRFLSDCARWALRGRPEGRLQAVRSGLTLLD